MYWFRRARLSTPVLKVGETLDTIRSLLHVNLRKTPRNSGRPWSRCSPDQCPELHQDQVWTTRRIPNSTKSVPILLGHIINESIMCIIPPLLEVGLPGLYQERIPRQEQIMHVGLQSAVSRTALSFTGYFVLPYNYLLQPEEITSKLRLNYI